MSYNQTLWKEIPDVVNSKILKNTEKNLKVSTKYEKYQQFTL